MTNRMPKNNFVVAVIVLAAVCLSCTFLKGRSSNSPYGIGDISTESFATVDPNTPFPAMSTDVIDELITDVPELSKHRDKVLEAEREAINGLLADLRKEKPIAQTFPPSGSDAKAPSLYPSAAKFAGDIKLIPAAYAAEPDPTSMGRFQQFLIGHQIGFFMVDAGAVGEADRGKSKTVE